MHLPFNRVWLLLITGILVSCSDVNTKVQEPNENDSTGSDLSSQETTLKDVTGLAYARAIAEYISSAYSTGATPPDTLFIGKHDQFPAITLPATIQGIPVLLLTSEQYEPKTKYRAHSEFVNMIDTQTGNHWDFKMVVFHDYGRPQHDFHVSFDYIPEVEDFTEDSSYFDFVYKR